MQLLRKWGSKVIVIKRDLIEIHRYFKSKEEWARFLEDPRISIPDEFVGKEAVVYILAFPQMLVEKKHTTLSKRLYIPRETLKEISKGSWVVELIVRIQLLG